ncbi:MAG: phenylalanine--tRNA ligase subunit beta [Anaerolineae bacterium]|nr:MAG: phenylalanine--tRNA ligase subunit beta [Anaerolineae bacterium]
MYVPISWLKDFVEIDIPVEEVARLLTFAGLEVEEIRYVGWPMPNESTSFKITGLSWDPEKIVVGEVREVMPHPNADRLVLCRLFDGRQEHTVLTGAPNLFPYKGKGPLARPLKVAYAKEGARLYDGHKEGQVLMTLKRTKIRGVESYSMVCSEKELGISEEHEGIIILDDDAPVGAPLADYMGDAVLSIDILPNMARNTGMLGIARELAALTGKPLKKPETPLDPSGQPVEELVAIRIENPELNPRFVLGLIRDVEIRPSPYWVQRRLRLAGVRPINCIVDATNYTMLELGEPLHAFDYDVLLKRAKGGKVTIITRTAKPGEKLVTLDGEERALDPSQVLVCDEAGALSIAGVMGGLESEVTEQTRNVLLEGAAWNFINIRRTANAHNLHSEASFRFSRGVHPALAEEGVRRGLYWMAAWSGGKVAPGLVDNYPLPPEAPRVEVSAADVKRHLGIELSAQEIADLLSRLEFTCEVTGENVTVTPPPFRMDIGEGVVGVADVMEEIARLYGYDRIPETRIADALPPQVGNPTHTWEESLRDLLAGLGLQEVITYRMTSPEREARLGVEGEHVRLANPVTPERRVLRRSLLASVLDVVERNARLRETLAFFEIGPVFLPRGDDLPEEQPRLAIAMTGRRHEPAWDSPESPGLDFYDLKGVIEAMLTALRVGEGVSYEPAEHPAFHPGKCARVMVEGKEIGLFGEIHPLVAEKYEFGERPVLAAEFDLEALRAVPPRLEVESVPTHPPVLEDIAVVVDESVPAGEVEALIRQTGGKLLADVRLFDVYRGEQVGEGKKSLAYSLTYQAPDRTLTDKEAARIRAKIVRRLERELGARLRG